MNIIYQRSRMKRGGYRSGKLLDRKRVVAVVPTYKPSLTTLELITSIRKWHTAINIVVVNDCIPVNSKAEEIFKEIELMSAKDTGIICVIKNSNNGKAAALNYGIQYALHMDNKPNVIITSDDDVMIDQETIPEMVDELYRGTKVGAVCSQSLVKNKHKNLLTRLQALEYQSFTATKIADRNLFQGPLVMQGMITAFRSKTLKEVQGFTPHHLIEDYDITVRLKKNGWRSAIAHQAKAWTNVPETFGHLWRQRVRWGYGGIQVVTGNLDRATTVFQDVLGHGLFLVLLSLIAMSWLFQSSNSAAEPLIIGLIGLAVFHLMLTMIFNVLVMRDYEEKDIWDWVIKMTIVLDLIYSNLITLVVLGCYAYFVYNQIVGFLAKRFKSFRSIYDAGLQIFKYLGYSTGWGTRTI